MELGWLAAIIITCVLGIMMAINILAEKLDLIYVRLSEIESKLNINNGNPKEKVPPRSGL